MPSRHELVEAVKKRVSRERGTMFKEGKLRVALVYPSPYRVGMASLGFQCIYEALNNHDDLKAERVFLPDRIADYTRTKTPLFTYESQTAASDMDVLAFSIAYETEITGFFNCLRLSGVPILRDQRDGSHPLVIAGGPLMSVNPAPLLPFVDLVVLGEAEHIIAPLLATYASAETQEQFVSDCDRFVGVYAARDMGATSERVLARAPAACLPARSPIRTPDSEFADMYLVEAARGCSRTCAFCVMRRESCGGMRIVAPEAIVDPIPPDVARVGLVGAAVTDHPQLRTILRQLLQRNIQTSVSSLRADRLDDELVELLASGGLRTLTIGVDGGSQRLRDQHDKHISEDDLLRAVELARRHELKLKLYQMIGLPGETDEDVNELVRFTNELAHASRLVLTISPFVPKPNTPLSREPFEPMDSLDRKLKLIRRQLDSSVDMRATSTRWAWIEYLLAQGDHRTGLAAYQAWEDGGAFADWKRAIRQLGRQTHQDWA